MSDDRLIYQTPLSSRYATREMSYLFSAQYKHRMWRKLWIALAKAERSLGLPITLEQIEELEKNLELIDWERVDAWEKELKHDVMAHLQAFAEMVPQARGILHLGATSCYVTDNTDLLQIRSGLSLLKTKLVQVMRHLSEFASKYASLTTVGFTHFQSAQSTTVGKRACLWLQEFMLDLHDLIYREEKLPFLGAKGATGTQASFMTLFDRDEKKVKELDRIIAKEMGFTTPLTISGQTYTRKIDLQVMNVLAGIATSAHKFATDLRLLSSLHEIEEPFGSAQVGSSAMPYKRNPVKSERVCSLARFLLSLQENPAYTAATQWLERSLDDSANRRLAIPEAFLCTDAILHLLIEITSGLVVHPKVIAQHLDQELPFLATETILMIAAKKGGDRQLLHARLRDLSLEAAEMRKEGISYDLLHQIASDPLFAFSKQELQQVRESALSTGRAESQVHEFLQQEITPLLETFVHLPPYIPSIEI